MYWIVFAFFTCVETFADIFVSWVPFYYELKIVFVFWLLSPATKGASILYRKFVHPQLSKREKEIDTYIQKASDQGYSALLSIGSQGFKYATNMMVTTAIKGQTKIADHLKKSYSMNDIDNEQPRPEVDETDMDPEDEAVPVRRATSMQSLEDNRVIEESYQKEMGEELDLRRRSKRVEPEELQSVDEKDEYEAAEKKAAPRKTHSQKEATSVSRSKSSRTSRSTRKSDSWRMTALEVWCFVASFKSMDLCMWECLPFKMMGL